MVGARMGLGVGQTYLHRIFIVYLETKAASGNLLAFKMSLFPAADILMCP